MSTPLPKTILYAEDDVVTATAFKKRLEQEGFRVETASDGLEALKLLHTCKPDLLLLDLMLPKFTGEEVLKFVTSNPNIRDIPVIVLSTNSILTAENESVLERADNRLLKHDCSFPKLLAAIDHVFDEKQVAIRVARRTQIESADASEMDVDGNPVFEEIKSLQEHAQVVCAWTDRIQIAGKWLKLTEFLSEHLHLKVTHGVSPEGKQQFLHGK
jgi:CheY-like chemotaxis protein